MARRCAPVTWVLKAGLGFTIIVLVAAWVLPDATEHLTTERLLRPKALATGRGHLEPHVQGAELLAQRSGVILR